jgi:hypothetical protein
MTNAFVIDSTGNSTISGILSVRGAFSASYNTIYAQASGASSIVGSAIAVNSGTTASTNVGSATDEFSTVGNFGTIVQTYSIATANFVAARGLYIMSDRRIKKNIVDINDATALSIFRKLKPKTYEYIDKINKVKGNTYGFIAQEVRESLPNSVSMKDEFIPSVYELADVSSNGYTLTLINKSTSDISLNYIDDSGNKFGHMKIYDSGYNEFELKVVSIDDDKSFTVDQNLLPISMQTDSSGSILKLDYVSVPIYVTTIDYSGNEISTPSLDYSGNQIYETQSIYTRPLLIDAMTPIVDASGVPILDASGLLQLEQMYDSSGNKQYTIKLDASGNAVFEKYTGPVHPSVFVYGHRVSDFHVINKDAIWTITNAATQEIDSQLQSARSKILTHEDRIAILEDTIAQQQATITNMQSEILAIKELLNK